MGVHSDRLAASKAHKHFVAAIKDACRKSGREIPHPMIPDIVGAEPLLVPVPPEIDFALGYRGNLRFVAFGYSPRTRQFCSCDGGDHIPANEDFWLWLLRHPLIAPFVSERRHPTLYGRFPETARGLSTDNRGGSVRPAHWLLLDRQERKFYLSRINEMILFFALAEPDDHDDHAIFVDGLLMSAGNEDYNLPIQPELTDRIRHFLDDQLRREAAVRLACNDYPALRRFRSAKISM